MKLRLDEVLKDRSARGDPSPSLAGFERAVERCGATQALDTLELDDLAFATACLEGDPVALRQLRKHWVPAAVSHVRAEVRDEIAAELLERLLMPKSAALAKYEARGSLKGWLRLVARRLAIDLSRRGQREEPGLEALPERMSQAFSSTPEWALLKARGRKEVAVALEAALDALTDDERRLLRWHFFEGVPQGEIGDRLGLSRSTVSLRLRALSDRLFEAVSKQLSQRLELDEPALRSLVDGARSGWLPSLKGLDSRDGRG
ncbi:MAG: sigma-70 family RNA polymerase sigma factor [Myxococcaceae bacterium]|nr:sigma-70 family RNA polymerase sigma factor [Myxococcaceae bacterium]